MELLDRTETKEINNIIAIYGNQNLQTLPTNMLGSALRALRLNPLEKEIIGFVTEFDRGRTGVLSKAQLTEIYCRKKQDADTFEQLVEAFRYIDKDSDGRIDISEFKYYMCKMGETMPEVDLDDILKNADVEVSGKIDVEKFSKVLFGYK